VIEVEAESPDLKRFSAAFVLARVYARVERVKNLIVARKQSVRINGFIASVDYWVERRGDYHHALVNRGDDVLDFDFEIFRALARCDCALACDYVFAFDPQKRRFIWHGNRKSPFRVAGGRLFS
jgi:hypothetical protein